MKEKPILFSAPMVRAILEGRKTQTRRVVKPMKIHADYGAPRLQDAWLDHSYDPPCVKVPYGTTVGEVVHRHYAPWAAGDRLWVREMWAPCIGGACGPENPTLYRATEPDAEKLCWKPSIFMPRWASRITLEVTGVRVERLQKISPADCESEGIDRLATHTMDGAGRLARVKAYRAIWEGINGPDSWEQNPWVWVIEFRRVTP